MNLTGSWSVPSSLCRANSSGFSRSRPSSWIVFSDLFSALSRFRVTSSSSSSSSNSSSDDAANPGDTPDPTPNANPDLKDAGSSGNNPTPGRHILHRVNPPGTKLQSAEEREAEDLDVAHFYIDQGDLAGAYLRGKDAVKTMPDDPEAHFLLAEIAAKLNKREEAIAEYNSCLKLDPDEKQAKDSRKALTRLQR